MGWKVEFSLGGCWYALHGFTQSVRIDESPLGTPSAEMPVASIVLPEEAFVAMVHVFEEMTALERKVEANKCRWNCDER